MKTQNETKRTLKEYLDSCLTNVCRWCGTRLSNHVDTYDHEDGWPVTGFDNLQWLSRKCPKCEYEWSLNKLGVPRL